MVNFKIVSNFLKFRPHLLFCSTKLKATDFRLYIIITETKWNTNCDQSNHSQVQQPRSQHSQTNNLIYLIPNGLDNQSELDLELRADYAGPTQIWPTHYIQPYNTVITFPTNSEWEHMNWDTGICHEMWPVHKNKSCNIIFFSEMHSIVYRQASTSLTILFPSPT